MWTLWSLAICSDRRACWLMGNLFWRKAGRCDWSDTLVWSSCFGRTRANSLRWMVRSIKSGTGRRRNCATALERTDWSKRPSVAFQTHHYCFYYAVQFVFSVLSRAHSISFWCYSSRSSILCFILFIHDALFDMFCRTHRVCRRSFWPFFASFWKNAVASLSIGTTLATRCCRWSWHQTIFSSSYTNTLSRHWDSMRTCTFVWPTRWRIE